MCPPPAPPPFRLLLRGVCVVAAFFSTIFAAHGVLMTGQFLDDRIPAGTVVAVLGTTKTGPRLRLDNGEEVVFSNQVLFQQPNPVVIAVGDHVEKRRDSFAYVVNGTALTGTSWVVRHWLLPVHLVVLAGAYLLAGTVYVLKYGRTPLGDSVWPDADPARPRRPRTRAGMICAMAMTWLLIAGLATAAFGCMGGCLGAVGRGVFG